MQKNHLGGFEALILAALLRNQPETYSVPIQKEIERVTGRQVSIGATYTTLRRLQAKGFVSARLGEPTAARGGRAKQLFKIEPAGKAALEETLGALHRMTEGLDLSIAGTAA